MTVQPPAPVIPSSGVAASRQRTADAGVVTIRLDPGSMVTLPARAYLTIPASLRRRCGMAVGDQVLLAALPGQDTLAAYSLAVVDQAIRAHGSFQHLRGGQP